MNPMAELCRCGTEFVAKARFCHHCGRRRLNRLVVSGGIRLLAIMSVITTPIAWLLIPLLTVESVLWSGPYIALIGLASIILSIRIRHWLALAFGVAHVLIVLFCFALVIVLDWGPNDAHQPFTLLGLLFISFTVPAGILIYRTTRAAEPDPNRCIVCDYLLYGLTEPRCPECGTPFDPAQRTPAPTPTSTN
jgi:hypothetical protein